MPLPKGRMVKTVKELREYLDECEATWTVLDSEYLGDFEAQELWVPYFESVPSSDRLSFIGYSHPSIDAPAFAGGTFVIDQPKDV